MFDFARLRNDLLALIVLAGTVYLGLCLASYDPADAPATTVFPAHDTVRNLCGERGALVAHWLITALGVGAFAVPVMLVVWDVRLFSRGRTFEPVTRGLGATLILGTVAIALQMSPSVFAASPPVGNGGYVGAWGEVLLTRHFRTEGVYSLLGSGALAGLVLANELRLFRTAVWVCLLPFTIWDLLAFPRYAKAGEPSNESPAGRISNPSEPSTEKNTDATPQPDELEIRPAAPLPPPLPVERVVKVNPPQSPPPLPPTYRVTSVAKQPAPFALPEFDLLDDAEEFPYEVLAQKAQASAAILERTFQEFGLNVRVVEIDTGPVITQFELELEAGLRLSKVTSLADDLAIALRVPSVRVVAPIPGKNTVGVEVPNDVRVMVRLKELLESCAADFDDKRLPLFLGKDVSGKPLVVDLCKMPHLLIAGRTGTGKSVCLNTLILSMLLSRTPEQVKLLLIDPKMVELSPYMRIPHLMHPVITDMKKAEAVLGWAVDKMEERYDLLARVGVRHLDAYNKLGKAKVLERLGIDADSEEAEAIPDHMPYIVIVADEMADMIMTSGKEVEGFIIRLAQKSRAVGIHLVLATQKPTVDVITGLIKSNLPARISFQVSSRVDSRVVLDELGAEKLLGNGDMLYLTPGTSNLVRAQGTFVSDEEVNRVIEFYSDQEPQYCDEIARVTTAAKAGGKGSGEPRERDDLYEQACEVVIREGRGSVSLLQRALGVGYGRGARMIDWMAEDGLVGTYNGSQAREVLVTLEQWQEMRAGA